MSKYSENMPNDLNDAIGWMYDFIEPHSSVLDFGCSTGYFGSLIKEAKSCKVYGVEISADKNVAKKVLDGVYSFDLDNNWPKKVFERKYDYLFFGDVLEHLKDPGMVLKRCHELLKPNGKIFVSVPNIAHISIRLELLMGSFEYEPMGILDNTHLKYFTKNSFSKLAVDNGYTIERIDSTIDEFPKEIIENYLNKAGLNSTHKFWKYTSSIEARAFQFKFILKPRIHNEIPAKVPQPIAKPEQYKSDFIDDLRSQIVAIDNHAKEQAKIIAHLERELAIEKQMNDKLRNRYLKSRTNLFSRLKRKS